MKAFSPVRYSLIIQTMVSLPCSLVTLIWGSNQALLSVASFLLGSGIFIIANTYFTHYAFRYRFSSSRTAEDEQDVSATGEWVRRSFVTGYVGKLALTVTGFMLVFNLGQTPDTPALFSGYILMIFTQWWLAKRLASIVAAQSES